MNFTFVITHALLVALAPLPERTMDVPTFLKEHQAQEQALLSFFQDETKWKDPDQKVATLKYLQAAKEMRSRSLAPLLARHIAYSPRPRGYEEDRREPIDQRFPVYGVLRSIGVPAVPALLNQLKESDPEDRERRGNGAREHTLIVHCLVEIYDQGGDGAQLARLRIELEAMKATGPAKKFLQRALEHPRLKGSSKNNFVGRIGNPSSGRTDYQSVLRSNCWTPAKR